MLLLEGRDGKLWKDHTGNCAPYHLPHIDGTVHFGTSHISAGLRYRLCSSARGATTMVIMTFVLLDGIWSVLLRHFWRFQLGSGLVQSVFNVEGFDRRCLAVKHVESD
jgi:hypothetical protein